MKISEIRNRTGYEEICKGDENSEVKAGYTGDLLSDVMANAPSDSVLVTIQAHKNTIAVATLANIRLIILCNGRKAPADMVAAADGESIAIFATKDSQFEVSAKLASLLAETR